MKSFPWWALVVGFLLCWGIARPEHTERAGGAFIALLAIVCLVLGVLYLLKLWTQGKLQKMQSAQYVPVDIAEFAGAKTAAISSPDAMPLPSPAAAWKKPVPKLPFDFDAIDEWSQQLHQMGFSWLMDYSFDPETRTISPGQFVCRLMVHPQLRIYACVRQTVMHGQGVPLRPSLYSLLDDGEIITVAAKAQETNLVLHRPQDVYDFMPEATPQILLQRHLERRNQVERFLGRHVRPENDLEFYMKYEGTGARRMIEGYHRTNIFELAGYLFTANSKRSVLGNLSQHVPG